MRIRRERRRKASGAKRPGQIVDQFRGRHKQRIEPVLDGAVRDGDREMRSPSWIARLMGLRLLWLPAV
jgi:hypothetical protein